MSKRELVCIGCPLGCNLEVEMKGNEVTKVCGHSCKRGEDYGRKECVNPTRIVTSSVSVVNGDIDIVPVKTQNDIPKESIFKCISELKNIVIMAPVNIGDIIVENVAGTGVNIVATKKVESAKHLGRNEN